MEHLKETKLKTFRQMKFIFNVNIFIRFPHDYIIFSGYLFYVNYTYIEKVF